MNNQEIVESFIGERYIIELVSTPHCGAFVFTITAVHRKSHRCSDVTNMNVLLTLLRDTQERLVIEGNEVYETDWAEEYDETDWLVHQDALDELMRLMRQVCRDPSSRAWLEDEFDKDRSYGEWANKRKWKC